MPEGDLNEYRDLVNNTADVGVDAPLHGEEDGKHASGEQLYGSVDNRRAMVPFQAAPSGADHESTARRVLALLCNARKTINCIDTLTLQTDHQ
jgi:hypothetical protein